MTTAPTISVVMPIYNGERFLRQAIASIRWQTVTDWELICVDDGSTDTTAEILEEFAATDRRIRVFHQANQGVVAARNHCLQHVRGPWIACLDCDDIARPDRFAIQLRFTQNNPEVLAVGSNLLCIDTEGLPIRTAQYAEAHEDIENALLRGHANSVAQPSVLMQRDAVFQVGQYRSEYEWVEDMDLWLRLAHVGKLANIPQELTYYRLHEQSVCWTYREQQQERLFLLLQEAQQIRGISISEALKQWEKPVRKQSPAAGKWARQAARAGFYRTAIKHWRRQIAAAPTSLHTLRISAEVMIRAFSALTKVHRSPAQQLPDWQQWDANVTDANTPKLVA